MSQQTSTCIHSGTFEASTAIRTRWNWKHRNTGKNKLCAALL